MGVTDPDSSGLGLGGGVALCPRYSKFLKLSREATNGLPHVGVCEEGTACPCCRDGNRCRLQQEGFRSDTVKNFQMLWV